MRVRGAMRLRRARGHGARDADSAAPGLGSV